MEGSNLQPGKAPGGDATVPGNYRGIAVSTVLAKLYASSLTRRLAEWTERHHLRAVGQAGFRAAHNTADQMLVMRTLIESARAAREPLYVCFVDFRKAYDSVPRDLLWRKLQSLGVTGWCLQAIQALYAVVPLVLQGAPVGAAPFHSHLGVKQGCRSARCCLAYTLTTLSRYLPAVTPT